MREHLLQAVDALPPAQRAVITLRDLVGASPEEVCELLELTDGNQRVLLHRARARVRTALTPLQEVSRLMRWWRRRHTHDPLVCREFVELVTDYLEGALPDAERARFEAHLAECDGCAGYLEDTRASSARCTRPRSRRPTRR